MKLMGFSGQMGVGKSAAIQALRDYLPPNRVQLVKFAQPLYDMQEMIYRRVSAVHKRKEGFVKDRKLLQWLGTDWGRETVSPTIWVDLWTSEARDGLKDRLVVVCDDVRFDNEADAVHSLGGVVIKLTSNNIADRSVVTNGIENHKSEVAISANLVDYNITNNGTLKEFQESLCKLYKELGVGQRD